MAVLIVTAGWITSRAQMEKTIHQSFMLENVKSVSLQLNWDIEIVPWEGSALMTETVVKLYDASPAILNYLIEEEKRYAINATSLSDSLLLRSNEKKREYIQTKNGVCSEIVLVKVHVPKDFIESKDKPGFFIRQGENK